MPRKFIGFHCLENESNELKESNTEGCENFPDLPQKSEWEVVIIEETETSLTKSLAVLQAAGVKESTVRESEDTNEERVIVGSQECLLSSSDEGSGGLEKFLRNKLDSLSGEEFERIVEVDPTVVLALLDESLVDPGSTRSNVVPVDKEMPKSCMDYNLRSELKEKRAGNMGKLPLCDVDADVAGERPSKSVAFNFDDEGGRLSSAGCELVGMSDAE